jgi:hypothetical protein
MKEQPQCKVDEYGNKEWRLHGKLHREDGPAYEYASGYKYWYLHGKLHREDGPACEEPGGTKRWFLNDQLHREDGPAIERGSGYKEWRLHDEWVHPETLVDLHLSRGTFCWWNEKENKLEF